nr:hypothetical protein [Candidatus Mycoplasma haematolamae]
MTIASLVLGGGILTNVGGMAAYQTATLTPEQLREMEAEAARMALPEEIRAFVPKGTPLEQHGMYIGFYQMYQKKLEWEREAKATQGFNS